MMLLIAGGASHRGNAYLCNIRTGCSELRCFLQEKTPGLHVSLHKILERMIVPEVSRVAFFSAGRTFCRAFPLLELQVVPYAAGADCTCMSRESPC